MKLHTRPTIGLIVCKPLNDPRSFQVWSGVSDAALTRGVNVICFPIELTHTGREQDEGLLELVSATRLDGLAIFHWLDTKEEFEEFYAPYKPLPVVTISRTFEGFAGVMEDNYQGMRNLMRHLLEEHGYRRIAYIHGPVHCQPSEDRYRAYVDSLREFGIPLDRTLLVPRVPDSTFVTPQRGAEAVKILLDQRKLRPQQDIEAIVARSDDMASGAMQELRRRGVQVPYDVAVAGYDNTDVCRTTTPPLTSALLPFYEIARQSTGLLVDMMNGIREPEHIRLPGELIVRQSCGCLPPTVKHALVNTETVDKAPVETILTRQRDALLTAISCAVGDVSLDPEAVNDLVMSFIAELNGDRSGRFLQHLDTVLREVIESGKEVAVWQNAISVLTQYAAHVRTHPPSCRAENLCQQARVMVQELTQWARACQAAKETEQASALRRIGQSLITTFDIAELMDVLARELPRLGFPGCYLSLYEQPDSPAGTARLVLAYTEHRRLETTSEGQPFPAQQLAPEGIFPQHRHFSMVVEPLYFRDDQIGFALFEAGPRDGNMYDILRSEISSALQGALLVKRMSQRSAELARQKYILETFMASVPDAIYFKDRESRFTKTNPAHALRVGVDDPSLVSGKNDFDFFPEEQARSKYEQEQRIIQTGQPVLAREEPDGENHWALTTKMPLRDEHGDIIGTFGISRDITDLKRAEAETQQQLQEIRVLYTISWIVANTPDMREGITQALGKYLRFLNLKQGGISLLTPDQQGSVLYALYLNGQLQPPEPDPLNLSQAEREILATGQPLAIYDAPHDPRLDVHKEFIRTYHVKSLLLVPLFMRGRVIGLLEADATEEPRHFSGREIRLSQNIAHQIATAIENTRLFEEEQHQRQEAEAANRTKTLFLSQMSHELRTPLNGILGYTQLLKHDRELTEAQRRAIETIHQSGEHLLALIAELLDYAKASAHKIELLPRPFSLQAMLDGLADMTSLRARDKGLEFYADIPAQLPSALYGDEHHLRQILLNLITNAIKYTEKGSVTLRVVCRNRLSDLPTPAPSWEGNIKSDESLTTSFRFEVTDTGIGMSPEHQQQIFTPFYQIGESQSSLEGLGLGLAICHQLIGLMGSELHVNSTPGHGSAFWFDLDLPLCDDKPEFGDIADLSRIIGFKLPSHDGEQRRLVIVVADDDPHNRNILRDSLSPLGFDIVDTSNGEQALRIVRESPPDLVLMDLHMPGMDGFEAARRIRAWEANHPSIPIIAMSASVSPETRQRSLTSGFDDFLDKPVQRGNLLKCLQRHLHLEWIHEEGDEPAEPPCPGKNDPVVFPPQEMVSELVKYAETGALTDLRQKIAHIKSLQPDLRPFAEIIQRWTDEFQFEHIVTYLTNRHDT